MRNFPLRNCMAYGRTLKQYWQNPKGRHDIMDFACAALTVGTVTAAAIALYDMFLRSL